MRETHTSETLCSLKQPDKWNIVTALSYLQPNKPSVPVNYTQAAALSMLISQIFFKGLTCRCFP